MVGTQISRFLIKIKQKISHLKGLQRTTPNESGALASAQCTRILCQPPTTFMFLWLQNDIHFANVVGTQITRFLIRNEPQNISFERVPQDNTRWVRCTNNHIEYQNIVFAFFNFSVHVVEVINLFYCCCFTVVACTKITSF